MTIPSQLEIGGLTYKVRFDDDRQLLKDGLCGQARYNDTEIAVLSDQEPQQVAQTFLHEVYHAINDAYMNGKGYGEDECDALAQGTLQVLKQLGVELVAEA